MKFLVFLCVSAATAFTVPTPQAPLRTLATALFAENGGTAAGKKILVLGGDGFCGWPTALYLSDQGHDVVVVDNLSRRNIDIELGCDSLTPIRSMEVRRCYCWGLNCSLIDCFVVCFAFAVVVAVVARFGKDNRLTRLSFLPYPFSPLSL
jgi:hypothetical protein